jgi:hypothetical protein
MPDESRSARLGMADVTFLLPFSFDCDQRLENLWAITSWIRHHFRGPVLIGGQDLDRAEKVVGHLDVGYVDVEPAADGQWRAATVRSALSDVAGTAIIAHWDVDVWCPPEQVRHAAARVRAGDVHFAYPYDGRFVHVDPAAAYGVSRGGAHPHDAYVVTTHPGLSVGGAVLFDTDTYRSGGRDNRLMVGWGPEDRERFDRFRDLGYRCARSPGPLYHLDHDRPHERYFGNPSYLTNLRLYGRPALGLADERCPVCRTSAPADDPTPFTIGPSTPPPGA